jgi:monofunctional biosynthetic peptidoglycan transglycosylase
MSRPGPAVARRLVLVLALLAWCVMALQAALLVRVALMAWVNPASTTFQRSEMLRLAVDRQQIAWGQTWTGYDSMSIHLKRAVIASEDAGFTSHAGADWEAMDRAWERNQRAQTRAAKPGAKPPASKLRGGSTITQQLAKNLLLSGERTVFRKAQELVLAWMLEAVLDKRRILELYLNHVEWGEGLFGAQAAARHYFRVDAGRLTPEQAARLAVMLPAPKRFEQRPGSDYLVSRSSTILARMASVELP